MSDFNHPPDSISHKQLTSLLKTAPERSISFKIPKDASKQDQETFNELLTSWSSISKQLLKELNQNNNFLVEGRSPKSLMALGAFQAHLNLAVQARKAIENS